MAAAYAFHIAENQPFVDGNKRSALDAALVFLGLNAWDVDDPEGRLYDAMIGAAQGSVSKVDLAKILEQLASPYVDEDQRATRLRLELPKTRLVFPDGSRWR